MKIDKIYKKNFLTKLEYETLVIIIKTGMMNTF